MISEGLAGTPDFTVVLRGYDRDHVDHYLVKLDRVIASGDPAAIRQLREELPDITFRVRFRGYERAQVDHYLRRTAAGLAAHDRSA